MNNIIISEHKQNWFEFTGYKPHEGQKRLHFPTKDARFTVAVCGRRWGKSVSASKEAETILTQKNKRVWVVAPTYGGAEKVFREVWNEVIFKQNMPVRRKSYKEQYIEFEWGSVFEGKSADNPNSLVGEGLDLLIIDEAAKVKKMVWDMYLRPTLSDRKGSAIFITTPEGYNWVYDNYKLGFEDEMWYSFNSPSWENQYAYPEGEDDPDLVEARRNMDRDIFDQEYGALFTSLAGRVWSFDRRKDAGHFPYDPDLPTYCSIDFGFRMPAVLWFQTNRIDGEWHIYIIDEFLHKKNVKTEDLAKMIKAKKYNVQHYFGDPAGKNVQGQSGLGDIEIFRRFGIVVKSVKDRVSRNIDAGCSHVRGFIENADGKRFLHVHNKCTEICSDLENYRYPDHKEGMDLKKVPIKDGFHDHGCDALRYFFINRFPIRQNKMRYLSR